MANRTFQEDSLTLVKRLVTLFPVVAVGVAGAVTLKKRQFRSSGGTALSASSVLIDAPTTGVGYAVGDGAGTRSVVRTAPGTWTITLSDSYQYLLGIRVIQVANVNGSVPTGLVGVRTGITNVTTNTGTGNGGIIGIDLNNGGGPLDPDNGDTLTLEITLGDATEP